mmetsp:Transcript_50230/g.129309  ORF Transcript_50230/g.129309 Transcript_50230/m.129309 type:complete len:345 (-) Transcript_50230:29-1063(-)
MRRARSNLPCFCSSCPCGESRREASSSSGSEAGRRRRPQQISKAPGRVPAMLQPSFHTSSRLGLEYERWRNTSKNSTNALISLPPSCSFSLPSPSLSLPSPLLSPTFVPLLPLLGRGGREGSSIALNVLRIHAHIRLTPSRRDSGRRRRPAGSTSKAASHTSFTSDTGTLLSASAAIWSTCSASFGCITAMIRKMGPANDPSVRASAKRASTTIFTSARDPSKRSRGSDLASSSGLMSSAASKASTNTSGKSVGTFLVESMVCSRASFEISPTAHPLREEQMSVILPDQQTEGIHHHSFALLCSSLLIPHLVSTLLSLLFLFFISPTVQHKRSERRNEREQGPS